MVQNDDLLEYYRKRAPIYDEAYSRPIKQLQYENKTVANKILDFLAERNVLELACGTGYWTQILSRAARKITAIDLLDEMLALAKEKEYFCPITFQQEDALQLPYEDQTFTGALANFLFSHIRKENIDVFLAGLHRVLQPDSQVLMVDNNYIPNFGGILVSKEDDQNTYKLRAMKDGSEHLILKNYFSKNELITIFSKHVRDFSAENIAIGSYYWMLYYEI